MMVTVRSQRNKGNSFENATFRNLKKVFPDIQLTKHLGFVKQYDLVSEERNLAIECKFHKSLSWNEMVKIWCKLSDKASKYEDWLLIFKTNRQPVLVYDGCVCMEFEDMFGFEFKMRDTE